MKEKVIQRSAQAAQSQAAEVQGWKKWLPSVNSERIDDIPRFRFAPVHVFARSKTFKCKKQQAKQANK